MFKLTISDKYDEDENIFCLNFKHEMIEIIMDFNDIIRNNKISFTRDGDVKPYYFDVESMNDFIECVKTNKTTWINFDYNKSEEFYFNENKLTINFNQYYNNATIIDLSNEKLKENFLEEINKMYLRILEIITL